MRNVFPRPMLMMVLKLVLSTCRTRALPATLVYVMVILIGLRVLLVVPKVVLMSVVLAML